MCSNTGEFSSIRNDIAQSSSRLAFSTARKNWRRRNIVKIQPLRLNDIEKELEEAERERLQSYSSSIPEENEENNEAEKVQSPEAAASKVGDSFDFGSSVLPLTTPAKPNKRVKTLDFITPKPDYRSIILRPSEKLNRMLEYQYVTPKNKVPQKIQCTVNMQTYLKTPLDKLCTVQNNSCVKKVSESEAGDCDLSQNSMPLAVPLQNNSLDVLFKKILVNKVEYIVLDELGKGGSSEVFLCYNVATKTHRGIKCVCLQNPVSATGYINEVKMLQTLQKCSRIIKMFDFEINEPKKTLLVVLEVGGPDLSKILKESALSSVHMPMHKLFCYWMEMLYAVKQIHSHGIIHSDLKPANFLQAEGSLKLIDFGISSFIQSDMTSVIKLVPEGSFNYISPEALNNESTSNTSSPSYGKPKYKISYKSDVWSLGCILYQMVYRKTPFQHVTQMWAKLSKILDPNHEIEYPEAKWVPKKILNTVKMCLQYNVKLRPSVDELIEQYENIFENLES